MTGIHATQSPVYRPGTRTATEQPEGSKDWMQSLLSAMGGSAEFSPGEDAAIHPDSSFPKSQDASDGKESAQGGALNFLSPHPDRIPNELPDELQGDWKNIERAKFEWTQASCSPETNFFIFKNPNAVPSVSPLNDSMYTDVSSEELDAYEDTLSLPLIFPVLTPETTLKSAGVTAQTSPQEEDSSFTVRMASQEKMSDTSFGTNQLGAIQIGIIRHSTTHYGTTRTEDSGVLDGFQAGAPLDLTSKSTQGTSRQQGNLFIQANDTKRTEDSVALNDFRAEAPLDLTSKSTQGTSSQQGNLFIQAKSSPAEPKLKPHLQDMLFQAHFQDHFVNAQLSALDKQSLSFPLDGPNTYPLADQFSDQVAEQVMEKIPSTWISQLHASEKNLQKEIRLQLHPEELGAVEVQMIFDDQGDLKVILSAEKEATKDLLEGGSQQLQEWLNQIGHEKADLSFSFQDTPKHPASDHPARSAPSGPQGQEASSLNDMPNDTPSSQPTSQSLLGLMDVTL